MGRRRQETGLGLTNALLLLATALFIAKFVFHWIPDPIDETTLYSTFIGIIMLLSGGLVTWLRRDLNGIHRNIESMTSSLNSIKTDIAVIKRDLKIP